MRFSSPTNDPSTGHFWVNQGFRYNSPRADLSGIYFPAITNILQLLISAIRLDMGLVLPNNVWLNASAMNDTLRNPFPEGLGMAGVNYWASTIQALSPPEDPPSYGFGDSGYIYAEYVCRFLYPIGWGEFGVNLYRGFPSLRFCPLSASNLERDGRDVQFVYHLVGFDHACDHLLHQQEAAR